MKRRALSGFATGVLLSAGACSNTQVLGELGVDGSTPPYPNFSSPDAGTSGQPDGAEMPFAPCEAKRCGDQCTLCREGDLHCAETPQFKFCTLEGECVGQSPQCGVTVRNAQCAGKTCGEECDICAGIPDCNRISELVFCNETGVCATKEPVCIKPAYDPCASKRCNDACTVCDPSDPECVETGGVKTCDRGGHCSDLPHRC